MWNARSGKGSPDSLMIRWFVSIECEISCTSRFGIWHPMQLFAGVLCSRAARESLQLCCVWQVRHLVLKYAGASSREGSICGLWHVMHPIRPALAR